MNKQELIEKIEALPAEDYKYRPHIDKKMVLGLVRQLDEPEKVTIPQFVANYIDISKFYVRTLHYALENSPEKVNLWLCENEINRQNTFARAWLDGYEIEKEKRYRISMPKARNYKNHAQILCEEDGKMFWCGEWYRFKTKFTRKQLEEAGFGWVFSCEGIEIEEVE